MIARILVKMTTLCLLIFFVVPARADMYFPTNTTINYAVSGFGYIGEDGMGGNSSPTVDLVTGGSIQDTLFVYNSSVFNMSGGSVGVFIEGDDSSSINVSGGTASTIDFNSSGTLNLSGNGRLSSYLGADNGTVNMTGGSASNVFLSDTFNLSGGNIGVINAGGGTLNVYGSGLYDTVESGRTPTYFLYGTLADGTVLNGLEVTTTGGETTTINLYNPSVPEPSTLLLASIGITASMTCSFRRRK